MIEETDIHHWVESAEQSLDVDFRRAVHTILAAISSDSQLKASMILKGGILLAVRYNSHRYTKDLDLSTEKTMTDINPDELVGLFDKKLTIMSDLLGYDLDCKVQGFNIMPANKPDASFPSIRIRVGYAYKGTPKHKRLLSLRSTTIVSIDYSLNEEIPTADRYMLDVDSEVFVYSLTDLIAEKYRSLLQQVRRNRNRRQDVFDLNLVLKKFPNIDRVECENIHASLIQKSKSRGINPVISSLDEQEVYDRAKSEYATLADEIDGELPDFDKSYSKIKEFYRNLPWK